MYHFLTTYFYRDIFLYVPGSSRKFLERGVTIINGPVHIDDAHEAAMVFILRRLGELKKTELAEKVTELIRETDYPGLSLKTIRKKMSKITIMPGDPPTENRKFLEGRKVRSSTRISLRKEIDIEIAGELKEVLDRAIEADVLEEERASEPCDITTIQIQIDKVINYLRIKLFREPNVQEIVKELKGITMDRNATSFIRKMTVDLLPP